MTLIRLVFLYKKERPDMVHHFTIKCVLYGSLASHIAGIKARVNAVTGLGHVFIDDGIKSKVLRPLVKLLYRLALRHTRVIFQNPSDRRFFVEHGLVSAENSCLIRGSGVDTKRFRPADEISGDNRKYVLLASRLLWTKGLAEYVEAAGIVRKSLGNVVFQIAGETDAGNPAAVPDSVIDEWARVGDVELLGYRDDMENLLRQVSIAVLPTYGEGVPRILIEAAACGLPLVATDIPGCCEVVRHGVNGLLVPARDSERLAEAIMALILDDELRTRMGKLSRQIACEEFAQDLIIDNILAVYKAVSGLS